MDNPTFRCTSQNKQYIRNTIQLVIHKIFKKVITTDKINVSNLSTMGRVIYGLILVAQPTSWVNKMPLINQCAYQYVYP